MDLRKIKALLQLSEEHKIDEIELCDSDGNKVRITRKLHPEGSQQIITTPSITPMTPAATAAPQQSSEPTTSDDNSMPEGTVIQSPMVGTAYLSPAPGSPTFVKVGQAVKKGDTLCLVEAMKMFNQIEAECSGTVVACLIENSQPVEFDQPIFIIKEG